MSEQNDKNAAKEKEAPPKPPGYQKFEKLLKHVIKAPPLPPRTPKRITDA
jgi:hypothetical protein